MIFAIIFFYVDELTKKIEELKQINISNFQAVTKKIIELKQIDITAQLEDGISDKILKFDIKILLQIIELKVYLIKNLKLLNG